MAWEVVPRIIPQFKINLLSISILSSYTGLLASAVKAAAASSVEFKDADLANRNWIADLWASTSTTQMMQQLGFLTRTIRWETAKERSSTILRAREQWGGGGGTPSPPMDEVLRELSASLESAGLDALKPGWRMGNLAMPRALEVGAALSRLRGLNVLKVEPPRAP